MFLFDMDGTLIDSNGIWKNVDREFLARRGLPYTHAYYEGVAHTIFPLAAKFTKEFCNLPESCEEIMAEWMELAKDLYSHVSVKPGVRAYLKQCKAEGRRMAVVTSSVPEHCYTALKNLDLEKYFDRIIFAQQLGLEKKKPELWLAAAKENNARPEAPSLTTAWPPAGAPGPPKCGWSAYTTVSLPRMKRKCGPSAMSISRALRNSCGCRSRKQSGNNKRWKPIITNI